MKPGGLQPGSTVAQRIDQIPDLLRGAYGSPERQPRHDPVEVPVGTILCQNTSDTNSGCASRSLLARFAT